MHHARGGNDLVRRVAAEVEARGLTHAYAIEEAPVVSAVSYTAVGFAVLWGWLFWDERPGRLVWAGGSLVVAAGVLLLWSRRGAPARRYVTDRSRSRSPS